jgi:uncharacterized lipoprotein YddW (UPF0748 family)
MKRRRGLPSHVGAIAMFLATLASSSPVSAQEDVRALWVVRTALTSSASIDAMVDAARAGGFNTLLVQVRGRGDAFYRNGSEPRAEALGSAPPSFDPLAHVIARAHAAGLRVHAWVNTNLVSNVPELPPDRAHVVHRHPEWLMVPREIAVELGRMRPSDPAYVTRLAAYVQGRRGDVEGLYLSPIPPDAAAYTVRVIENLARRYAVDGIHLDYVRYPAEDFDHSRAALSAFRRAMGDRLSREQRRSYDARADDASLTYVEAFPEEWREFRRHRLTALVARIRQAVKAVRPSALLSAAVVPDPVDAVERRYQDWAGWIQTGVLDVICPMVYTTDAGRFAEQVAIARGVVGGRHALWTGIGAYRLSADRIVENVRTARGLDVGGIIFFSYDSLAGTPEGPSYVAAIGQSAFAP